MSEEPPCLINEERLERRDCFRVVDESIGPMQNVEKQRFNEFRVTIHSFKVEALEPRQRERVFLVVKDLLVLTAAHPLLQPAGQGLLQGVCQHAQGPQIRRQNVEVLNLRIQVFHFSLAQRIETAPFGQHFHQGEQEIQVFPRRLQRERVDGELGVFRAHLQISAAEELRNAAEASTQIEDESIGRILLQVRYQEIEKERFPRSGTAQDNRVRCVLIVQVQEIRIAVVCLQL